mmetsp:Transcript_10576/g.17299  ORF Transcript_10576/g.17299 Transcript_10576/m.17299 type:complete len:386 (+) Transcript_10576:87-1244(+)
MARNRVLTEEMVFQRTKCNRMDLIRNLNLWGNDLQQITALRHMPNLEVLSLSVNNIESLADIRSCPKLTELYLRKNNIADLSEVRHLRALRMLKVLWLSDNPCATLPQYRAYVLHHLPNLVKLDSLDVTEEERRQAAQANVDQIQTHAVDDPPELTRRFSAPDQHQEDMLTRDRRSGGGRNSYGSPTNYYEEQQVDQRDFHISSPGPNYHGQNDRDAMFDDSHSLSPRNEQLDPPHTQSYENMGDSGVGRPALRRSYTDGYRSANVSMEQQRGAVRSAWDSPETPSKSRQSIGGESSNGDSRSRFNRSPADRGGGGPRGEAYMHNDEPANFPQAGAGGVSNMANGSNAARADNILCAVLALIKELDQQGLELVRRAIEQRQQSES